jgi:hypothetical protein
VSRPRLWPSVSRTGEGGAWSTSSATNRPRRLTTDEQAEALDHARSALAVHAAQLRGIERDYRARLLDEPAQLVASAAEQAEGSAEVIAHMLNPLDLRPHGDGADPRSLSRSARNRM